MRNTLFYGDNLKVLRDHVADASVGLVYLDPPFNSNRDYNVLFKEQSGADSPAQGVYLTCGLIRRLTLAGQDERKPRVFIGSSVESLEVAEAILYNLDHVAEVTPWSGGIFQLSATALESLLSAMATFDFAVFVFSPDDVARIRRRTVRVARDNVVFELGLFIGHLGKERCFMVVPRNQETMHLPTDLLGFTPGTYEAGRTDQNWQAALTHACVEIKSAIRKQGLRPHVQLSVTPVEEQP